MTECRNWISKRDEAHWIKASHRRGRNRARHMQAAVRGFFLSPWRRKRRTKRTDLKLL